MDVGGLEIYMYACLFKCISASDAGRQGVCVGVGVAVRRGWVLHRRAGGGGGDGDGGGGGGALLGLDGPHRPGALMLG